MINSDRLGSRSLRNLKVFSNKLRDRPECIGLTIISIRSSKHFELFFILVICYFGHGLFLIGTMVLIVIMFFNFKVEV